MTTSDQALDPITVEVVRHKLEGIANEMQSTLLRSSFSPIVKEGLDASASLFTPDGTTLAQSCSIPIHLATLIPAVAEVLKTYPVDTMRKGDTFILNDPYTGGTHLPDIAVITPVFHRGQVIALGGAMTHHQDVGGMSAGSVPTNATEIYQEGLRIPPLKLREGGQYNDTLVKMLRQNVRIPDTVMGDLNAQVAACTVASRRLGELAERYGHNQLAAIFDELLLRSETMTRQALRAIPEGVYRCVDYLDNDGIELDKPIRIEVAAIVKDGTITFDFEGTSPQVRGPAQLRALGLAGGGLLRRPRPHRSAHSHQRRLLPPGGAAASQGLHRQPRGAGAGQCANLHHQAHHHLHDRRTGAGAAGQGAGVLRRRAPGDGVRRPQPGWPALCRGRAGGGRQRRQPRP